MAVIRLIKTMLLRIQKKMKKNLSACCAPDILCYSSLTPVSLVYIHVLFFNFKINLVHILHVTIIISMYMNAVQNKDRYKPFLLLVMKCLSQWAISDKNFPIDLFTWHIFVRIGFLFWLLAGLCSACGQINSIVETSLPLAVAKKCHTSCSLAKKKIKYISLREQQLCVQEAEMSVVLLC